jgi:protein SCO1/2
VKQSIFLTAILILCSAGVSSAQTHPARGLVLQIDAPHGLLTVSCDEIPNYMAPMVMSFSVSDLTELAALKPGDMIDFDLVVDQHSSHIEKIRFHHYEGLEKDPLGARRLRLLTQMADPASRSAEVKLGEHAPDFSLSDQNHQKITLSQLAGRIVVLTFIYTHCPLPDFCFRVSNNFSQLQKRFKDSLGRDLILLSVTFDPEHDTPEVLAEYGKTWNVDQKGWHLLTGPKPDIQNLCHRFGMNFWPDEGLMTHSLHTVVLDRAGALVANLEGNEYTAQQLGDLVQSMRDGSPRPLLEKDSHKQP